MRKRDTVADAMHRWIHGCELCGPSMGQWLEAHHIKYRSHGGTDDPSNRIMLCKGCHDMAHSNPKCKPELLKAILNRPADVTEELERVWGSES